MGEHNQKIVLFGLYCSNCKHWKKEESEEPCWECLAHPANYNSHKPICYDKKEEKK